MKIVSFAFNNCEYSGVLSPDGLTVYPFDSLGVGPVSTTDFIKLCEVDDGLIKRISSLIASPLDGGVPLSEVTLLSPITQPEQDVICLGVNYLAHRQENISQSAMPDAAVYFSKRATFMSGPDAEVEGHFDLDDKIDYEVELAVILKKDARNVPVSDVYDYIFGYSVFNDLTARTIQRGHNQWFFGKSLDGHCAMGPWIVTEDCFERPPVLSLTSKVNGELRQSSSTDLLMYDIPFIINELSSGMTLKAGTIIATGTPGGVGMAFDPPKCLKPGDVVECEIENVGIMRNTLR